MRRPAIRSIAFVLTALALCFAAAPAAAQPVTPGNLIIYRVGDGTAALGTAATAVFLDEYTPTGTLLRSITVPTTGVTALTATGNSTTEGIISRSQDATHLVFTGYRKDVGGTNPSADAPATTNRVIGTLALDGTVNTGVALTDPTGTIRSATSVSGSGIDPYYIATSTQVGYIGTPGPAATTALIDARNSRQVNLSGNVLYGSNASTAVAGKVQSYGTLPTGTTAPTPIISLATANGVNGFFLTDVSPTIAGDDTIYAIDPVGALLLKYSFDGTTWNANGSIPFGGTQPSVTGLVAGSAVQLYMTNGTTLQTLTDASGFGGTLAGTPTTLATAGTNTAFRGVGVFPTAVPEPSSLALLGVAAAAGLYRKFRRKAI